MSVIRIVTSPAVASNRSEMVGLLIDVALQPCYLAKCILIFKFLLRYDLDRYYILTVFCDKIRLVLRNGIGIILAVS